MDGQTTAPPPPPGFDTVVPQSAAAAPPPPPPGFDTVVPPPAPTAQPSMGAKILDDLKTYDPNVGLISGAVKEAQKHVAGAIDLINKYVIAPNDPGATETTRQISQKAQAASDWLRRSTDQTTMMEKAGGWGESTAELLAPEMWGGKAVEGMSYADRLGAMAKNAKILESNPGLARVLRAGVKAVKPAVEAIRPAAEFAGAATRTGAEMGAQEFVESGGDAKAAEKAALTGAVAHGVVGSALNTVGAAAGKIVDKISAAKAAADAAEAAPGKFAQSATDVLQNAYDRLGVQDKAPQVSDYGQAAKDLQTRASAIYDDADKATDGKWRQLNAAIQAAKGSGDKAQEAKARADMEELVGGFDDTSYGRLLREATDRARGAFHDHYTLDSIHDSLVNSFKFGTPESAAMQGEANTFSGGKLFDQLKNLERDKDVGRERMVDLMGESGLKSLYDLADTAKNPVQNQSAVAILKEIANRAHNTGSKLAWASGMLGRFLPSGVANTAAAGYGVGTVLGAGEAGAEKLMHFTATKPRLTNLLTYAAKHGVSTRYAATLLGEAINQEVVKDSPQPAATTGVQPNAGNQ